MPQNITHIPRKCFAGCESLQDIDLSNMDDLQLFHEALGELIYRKSEIKDKILEDNFKSCEKTQNESRWCCSKAADGGLCASA